MSSRLSVALRDVSFSYDSSSKPLMQGLSVHFPRGFTGVVGANGAGKTSLLQLVVGYLSPTAGHVEGVADALYCAQRTDVPPPDFADFLEDWDGEAQSLRGRLGIDARFLGQWASLSHGERKRAQIGHALWRAPDVLAIDEPTNHIDASARDLLVDQLKRYRGVGLIVSHDRELLDELCIQSVWLGTSGPSVFQGGYTAAQQQREHVTSVAVKERQKIRKAQARLEREVQARRDTAAKEHDVRSKRRLSLKDSDGRAKIDGARVADSGAGSGLRQLSGRRNRLDRQLADAPVEKTFDTGIWLPGSRSTRNALLRLDVGSLSLGDDRQLSWPQIELKPDHRIALMGANGSGKSTWIQHILPLLNAPDENVVVLPQEITASAAAEVLREVQALPNTQLGHLMTIVSRLNSRPNQVLESKQPSPGEIRKLMLALGMSRSPHIIVMDEPTNHLDLPSIEALEQALAACPCALLLVSHDQRFVEAVGAHIWRIEQRAPERFELVLP